MDLRPNRAPQGTADILMRFAPTVEAPPQSIPATTHTPDTAPVLIAVNNQVDGLRNFGYKTYQSNLAATHLITRQDPDRAGLHTGTLLGRANTFIHGTTDKDKDNRLGPALVSLRPVKLHGTEFDFGQFVTFAGAEGPSPYRPQVVNS